mmetsp:Transcript_147274/g.410247  ORF Transcript_147274/g.410247 Transcript_147274/m.410247 type:complete len:232 (+) Transcript_147274:226-921(+)
MIREDLPARHLLHGTSTIEELHEVQHMGLSRTSSAMVSWQEHAVPAILHGCAIRQRLDLHRLAGPNVPQGHAEVVGEGERQLRAQPRLMQQQLRVVPRGARIGVVPSWGLQLRAHDMRALLVLHLLVLDARRQAVVEHAHHGREGLVPHGEVRVVVSTIPCLRRVPQVSHANDLAPHRAAKDALAPGHEQPHCEDFGVLPRHAVDTIHVAPEGGALGDHLVPILVQRPQEH